MAGVDAVEGREVEVGEERVVGLLRHGGGGVGGGGVGGAGGGRRAGGRRAEGAERGRGREHGEEQEAVRLPRVSGERGGREAGGGEEEGDCGEEHRGEDDDGAALTS